MINFTKIFQKNDKMIIVIIMIIRKMSSGSDGSAPRFASHQSCHPHSCQLKEVDVDDDDDDDDADDADDIDDYDDYDDADDDDGNHGNHGDCRLW